MADTPESVFEAIVAYVVEVRRLEAIDDSAIQIDVHYFRPALQAPKYHIALEAILVAWILYLLFFSKQYRPESKHDKLTKEVKRILWSRVKVISSKPYNWRLQRNTTMDNFNQGRIC